MTAYLAKGDLRAFLLQEAASGKGHNGIRKRFFMKRVIRHRTGMPGHRAHGVQGVLGQCSQTWCLNFGWSFVKPGVGLDDAYGFQLWIFCDSMTSEKNQSTESWSWSPGAVG